MENKSISIQCDEVTKNIMEELQDEMVTSLTKVSKDVSGEILEKLKPIEKRINDLREDISDENEEALEKLDDLNKSINKMTSSIENVLEECLNNVMTKEDNILNNKLKELSKENESIKGKLEENNKYIMNLNTRIDDLEKIIQSNFFDHKMLFIEKLNKISGQIDEKNMLIQIVNKLEGEHSEKLSNLQEEVEYLNQSFFSKIFKKK